MSAAREIWVAGYPSMYGGADTELDHNIDLWLRYGVAVHLVPNNSPDPWMNKLCDDRGCRTHAYEPGIFAGKTVVSFCNGGFLDRLPEIIERGRPACIIWFNCMTWTFEKEILAHRNGWIDRFGFVSSYQRSFLRPLLETHGPVQEFEGYRPYFNPENQTQIVRFQYRAGQVFCRRPDFARRRGQIRARYVANVSGKCAHPLPTKTFILGYGSNAHARTGPAPAGLDWQTWLPGEIAVSRFYETVHCILHKTGGSRESYCRIVPEAYAYGVPIIVEDDFAFPELVENGVTGYRCTSSDEMSFRASELAFDEPRRKKMIFAAREHLLHEVASPERCWEAWERLL